MIRIANLETNGNRALIKNLKDEIKDLAFAYTSTEIILGCVDCNGNILVYKIEETQESLQYPFSDLDLTCVYHRFEYFLDPVLQLLFIIAHIP